MTSAKQLMETPPEGPDTPAKVARRTRTRKAAAKPAEPATVPEKSTPAKKPRVKKEAPPPKRTVTPTAKILKTEPIELEKLHQYHKNPRIGNVDLVAKSLHINGQFKPIVVNYGTKTGRPMEILAGNHTYLGAKKELQWQQDGRTMKKPAWDKIVASFVDVDEEEAIRIVLADNRTGDDSTYDDRVLVELFAQVPDMVGTGYSAQEADDLFAQFQDLAKDTPSLDEFRAAMPEPEKQEPESKRRKRMEDEDEDRLEVADRRGATRSTVDEATEAEVEEIDVSADLQAALQLKEDEVWKGRNDWQIPELRRDMLVPVFDGEVKTWGGHAATPDDGSSHYLFNYTLGGKKGLPMDRAILSFFTYDAKFVCWYDEPAWYTARHLVAGLKMVVVPDFSFYYTDPRVIHLWSVFRAQWLGRYFQEAGLKVIPRFQFDFRDPKTMEISLIGIPDNPPVLAISQQNGTEEDEKAINAMVSEALETINPDQLLFYSGPPGRRMFERMRTKWNGDVRFLPNYAEVRRGTVFDKKEGQAGLTTAQKKAQRERLLRGVSQVDQKNLRGEQTVGAYDDDLDADDEDFDDDED